MDKGIREANLKILELEQLLDTANEVGKFRLIGENGRLVEQGTYIVIWKQEFGQWKLHRNMFNSSLATEPSINLLPLATKNYN